MRIEKLPSGNYRARVRHDGKWVGVTFDHYPTQEEYTRELSMKMAMHDKEKSSDHSFTFMDAAKQYVEMKRNILSVNTIKCYIRYPKLFPEWFTSLPVQSIGQPEIDKLINYMTVGRSPKTIKNYHGFVSAVLYTFNPSINIYTTLPQKKKVEPYIPTDEEVSAVLKEAEGTMFYIPFVLGVYGMRLGEICALTVDDIDGDVVHITKSLATDENNNIVIKQPKTTESTRDIVIPMEIADMIRAQGYVYNGHFNSIHKHLALIIKKLGIQYFTFHKLRHYFASALSEEGVPDADIMYMGGWNSDHVMKTVYRHSMAAKIEEKKRDASNKLLNRIK